MFNQISSVGSCNPQETIQRWSTFCENPSHIKYIDFLTPLVIETLSPKSTSLRTELNFSIKQLIEDPYESLFKNIWLIELKKACSIFEANEQEHLYNIFASYNVAQDDTMKEKVSHELDKFTKEHKINPLEIADKVFCKVKDTIAKCKEIKLFHIENNKKKQAFLYNNELNRIKFIAAKIGVGNPSRLMSFRTPLEIKRDSIEIKSLEKKIGLKFKIYEMDIEFDFLEKFVSDDVEKQQHIQKLQKKKNTLCKDFEDLNQDTKSKLVNIDIRIETEKKQLIEKKKSNDAKQVNEDYEHKIRMEKRLQLVKELRELREQGQTLKIENEQFQKKMEQSDDPCSIN
jgi:hypothetical protein